MNHKKLAKDRIELHFIDRSNVVERQVLKWRPFFDLANVPDFDFSLMASCKDVLILRVPSDQVCLHAQVVLAGHDVLPDIEKANKIVTFSRRNLLILHAMLPADRCDLIHGTKI